MMLIVTYHHINNMHGLVILIFIAFIAILFLIEKIERK
jgi:hypothetical protein